ncbi:MAG: hypothetical protein LBR26_06575 [Prevotella sp.]|nr:hypothetical protein [Prevotella sp.]
MHKTTATARAVHRKTFTRFFGQGVFSLLRDRAGGTGQPVAGAFLRFFPAMPVILFFLFSLLPVLSPAQGLPVTGTGIKGNDTGTKATGISHIDPYAPKVFYFPFGSSDLLRDYADNRRMFEALDSLLRTEEIVSGIDTVQILAGCSPAGSEEYIKNEELGMKNKNAGLRMEKSMRNKDIKMRICRDVTYYVSGEKHGKQQDVYHIPHIFNKYHQKGNYLFGNYPGLYICCLIINLLT